MNQNDNKNEPKKEHLYQTYPALHIDNRLGDYDYGGFAVYS